MSEAPILILLAQAGPSPGAPGLARGPDGEPAILGLSLIQRAVLAARRAGFGQVFLLGGSGRAAPEVAAVADWRGLAATIAASRPAPLVIAPATVLAETGWLERTKQVALESTRPIAGALHGPPADARPSGRPLERGDAVNDRVCKPAAWAAIPNRIVLVFPASAADALAALGEGARDMAAVEDRLARSLGAPLAMPAAIDPMAVETAADVGAAERRLLSGLVKDTDGFMARHVERPISLSISRRLAATAITPNEMSLISILVGVCGGPFFLFTGPVMQTIGALLFLAHSILDGCDGELARLKFQQSRWGGILDFWGDNVVHSVIFACMSVGWSLSLGAAWPLTLGLAAVLGTLGSAGFVYWRLMRLKDGGGALFTSVTGAPDRPLARLLDAASRRDFIYLVVLLGLFGRSNWFLVLAAIGAPVYFALVLFASRAPRPAEGRGGASQPEIGGRSLGRGRIAP